jgi:serine/threonine protein phosphatase 1
VGQRSPARTRYLIDVGSIPIVFLLFATSAFSLLLQLHWILLMLFSKTFVTLSENLRGCDYLVGDLHGQGALLDRGLSLVKFDPSVDRLIALGDVIDRGPHAERLLRQVQNQAWFIALRGNHEAMMQEAMVSFSAHRIWSKNGNDWAQSIDHPQLESLSEIIDGLPVCIELPLPDGRRIGLIHAEVPVGKSWDDLRSLVVQHGDGVDDLGGSDASSALWGRRRLLAWAAQTRVRSVRQLDPIRRARLWDSLQPVSGIDLVVAGHSVLAKKRPVAIANLLWIDTGAYLDEGRLTLVDIHHGHYWQVGHSKRGTRVIRRHAAAVPVAVPLDQRWRPTAEELRRAEQEERDRLNKPLWWM